MKNNLITQDKKTFELVGDINQITLKGLEVLKSNNMIEEIEDNGTIEVYSKHLYNNCYEVSLGCNDYLLVEGFEESQQEAVELVKELLMEDYNITDNLIWEAELKGWIKEEYFKEVLTEINENIAYNEDLRCIAWDDELEQIETGELDEDDFREEYFNRLQDSIGNDWIGEYKNIFGYDSFYDTLIEKNLIDLDKLAKWCVEMDGAGHYLASYDGEELEHNNIFLYRIN